MEIDSELNKVADKEKAKLLQRFFKTGKGEYGEGDIFLGIVVPKQRKIAKQFVNLSLKELQELINSKFHEKRLVSLLILTYKWKKAGDEEKREIYDFYLKNTKSINNWDLVDLSAPNIVGSFLLDKNREILYKLVKSENLWERRISVLATFMFIKNKQFEDSLRLAEILLKDKHDLIHKAVGWMLREIGKRDISVLCSFLDEHCKEMPRTMLRYAIEKLSDGERKRYLNGEI